MIERYYPQQMKKIWDEKSYYSIWKDIEMALLRARGRGDIALKIRNVDISPEAVREKESVSGHELNAFLEILEENVGSGAGEIHKGLTSSDVMDTARIIQIKESVKLIEGLFKKNLAVLKDNALKYKDLIMCGRTHGQFAEPITLGLKFARFYQSGKRSLERLSQAKKRLFVGQVSGAVGTYSSVTPDEEEKILGILGLKSAGITSQVIPRDIFAEYVFIMGLMCALAEEIAVEIRLLAQDGIKEVTEPFTKKQTGSSAMPHKKNPVICERICGLSRLVRSYCDLSISNIALWNERDISHSSNERIMLEEVSALTYYILQKLEFVITGIDVHRSNIRENIKKAGNKLFSSGVLKLVLDKGASRRDAYTLTQKLFIKENSLQRIKTALKKETGLTEKEVKKAMTFEYYIENIGKIYKRLGL